LIQPDTLKKKYPPKTRAIQFHYAVPFFQHSDEICFKYKLSGFDNQWSHWTNKTDKEYINLPPGGYSFTVLAKNMYQFESNPATYSFWITPFWHNTLVARAAFIILLIFIIVFAVFFHFRRVHWAILNERKKYESTFLPAEISEKYVKNLIMLMEIEKPYRNPEITLSKLSELLSIPSYHLSQIINDKKNMNFNEFINSYRINEAIEILNRNNSPKNTMDIAFSVGFNSKSAFYAAFKKHTHMTPTKFRKQLNNVL
jgi:AraC-like DNA-binding protein